MLHIQRPSLFQLYVVAVVVAGVVDLTAQLAAGDIDGILGEYPLSFAIFATLLVLTELRPMTYHADGGEVTASWTFAFALIFIAPVAGCLVVVSLTTLSADLARSKSISRAAFNASQFILSLSAGHFVGSQIHDLNAVAHGEKLGFSWLAAATAACALSFLLNALLISVVIALHQGMPVHEMLRRSITVNLRMDGLLLALSPIFLLVGVHAPILVPLLLGTVIVIFRSATLALSNRHEATHDQLTGIPNRRLFEDHTELLLSNARRSSRCAGLIHIDLDGFKGINDRLGHHYGDEVLKTVAARLQANRRPTDFVARLGGDEFVVTLGSVASRDAAEGIARRLLEALREPMLIEGVPLAIDASMGVATFPDDGDDLHTLLNHADVAMYTAKSQALGVQVYATAGSEGPNRLQLLADLQRAVDNDELELYYQPKVEFRSGTITGVEALIRWNHPEFGLVEPAWFMPQAEQTELMTPLTERVLNLAVAQCVAWIDEGIRVTVSANASARSLHDLKFPGRVRSILDRHGLDAGWLELEITENSVMADPIRAASVIGHLRAIGVSLAIDDFGTGYSSLASLRTLTIDRIKIDRSFISDLHDSGGDITIVRSVVELGKALGLVTVAEGIETQETFEILRDLGCDEFQGYLVSRALPAAEVTPLLRERGNRAVQPVASRSRTP